MRKKKEWKKAEFSGTIFGPLFLIRDAKDALIDWSCGCWRSPSEMVAKAPSDPWMREVDANFFFWSERNSSIICAFTGGVLPSWQIPLCVSCVWIFASPLRGMTPTLEGVIGARWFWEGNFSSSKGNIFGDWDKRANERVFHLNNYRSSSEAWSCTVCAAAASCATPAHLRQHTTAIGDLYQLTSSATWTSHTNSEERATNSI